MWLIFRGSRRVWTEAVCEPRDGFVCRDQARMVPSDLRGAYLAGILGGCWGKNQHGQIYIVEWSAGGLDGYRMVEDHCRRQKIGKRMEWGEGGLWQRGLRGS